MNRWFFAGLVLASLSMPAVAEKKAQPAPPPPPPPAAQPAPKEMQVQVPITFTEDEITALNQLLDVAVGTCKLRCAGNVSFLASKISAALETARTAAGKTLQKGALDAVDGN